METDNPASLTQNSIILGNNSRKKLNLGAALFVPTLTQEIEQLHYQPQQWPYYEQANSTFPQHSIEYQPYHSLFQQFTSLEAFLDELHNNNLRDQRLREQEQAYSEPISSYIDEEDFSDSISIFRYNRSDDELQNEVPNEEASDLGSLFVVCNQKAFDDQLKDEPEVSNGCSICQSPYSNGEMMTTLPCSIIHNFHSECIETWLNQRTNCPICRKDIFDSQL